jgi:hypothetical protein
MSRRGDADLRGSGDAKRRRQLRLVAAQSDAVQHGRLAAGRRPEVGEKFSGTLHGPYSSLPLVFVLPLGSLF